MAFGLVRNEKSADFLDRLLCKYAPQTALSLLKLRSEVHNSKLESIEKDPDEWILNLEFGLKGKITDEDFMIHILNHFPEGMM